MKVRITVEGAPITASLIDNATSRDFVSLLPGVDPAVGDITYDAPWGNLALFHRDAGYAAGLIRLGSIDSGFEALSTPGPLATTIELIKEE